VKLVLPVHHFPPRYSAGAELYTFRLARWLQARGHQVEVVCVEAIDQGRPGELRAEQDTYAGIPVWRLAFNLIDAAERRRWDFDNPLIGEWFAGYLRRAAPDIVHFQAGYLIGVAPLEAAHAAGIPTVLTLHDYWYLCPRITLLRGNGALCESIPDDPAGCAWCARLERRRYRALDQISGGLAGTVARAAVLGAERDVMAERRARLLPALALPDAAIAPSQFLAERFAPFVPADRMHISRYGLDLAPFQQRRARAQAEALRVGFIGQIAPHKGVHLLAAAFRALRWRERPIELHIYGGLEAQPRYVAELRERTKDDPRIHLHGRFENGDVAAILNDLDVVVVPSVWYENSPLAIMEAQAAGTPVITSALGGMAELVRDEVDGLHFRPADAADLARQLQRLLDEPDLLPRLRAGVTPPRSIDDEMVQILAIYAGLVSPSTCLFGERVAAP
jgi:glycosyltransferase involved in cell wall biosynthesis